METIAGIAGVILLIIIFFSSDKKGPEYEIRQIDNSKYYEVLDSNGNRVFIGTKAECDNWLNG